MSPIESLWVFVEGFAKGCVSLFVNQRALNILIGFFLRERMYSSKVLLFFFGFSFWFFICFAFFARYLSSGVYFFVLCIFFFKCFSRKCTE